MSVPHSTSSVGYGLNGLGIALGCVGSISINIGNNLQSRGLDELNPSQSTWLLGTVIFFVASIIQFVAFAFAPASVVAPLESLQFVRRQRSENARACASDELLLPFHPKQHPLFV